MGKIKNLQISAHEWWDKVGYHNEQFANYKQLAMHNWHVDHVKEYHNFKAFEAECNYVDMCPDYYKDEYLDYLEIAR